MEKQRILIVDDEEINRLILDGMFDDADTYETIEASNGQEAISHIENNHGIVLILLDILMPVLDGFGVLEYMKEHGLLEEIPVILITSETIGDSEEKAYSYGVADVIHKPFYPNIVKKRSWNIIDLYQNKHNMAVRLKEQEEALLAQQKELNENNEFMIDALSSVVESRSAETGEHTKRIKNLTRIMLKYFVENFPQYGLTPASVDAISRASVMHDVGKIGISDTILLKPGRLTPEEFEIMKSHTIRGCGVLEQVPGLCRCEAFPLICDMCRHHHERWDGSGYPDRLAGDSITPWVQVVGLADAFDALIHPRVYKPAYPQEQASDMIVQGACGAFDPMLLACFAWNIGAVYQKVYV